MLCSIETKPTHEYLKVSLGLYIINRKKPGMSQGTWTINASGIVPLSRILLSVCQTIINMALVFMPADEVLAEVKKAAEYLATCKIDQPGDLHHGGE